MKRALLLPLFVAVMALFVACEDVLPDVGKRTVTQSDIVGTWDCGSLGRWNLFGKITIDKYGNFTMTTDLGEDFEPGFYTGTIKIANSYATVVFDSDFPLDYSGDIKASQRHPKRWYVSKDDEFPTWGFGANWTSGEMESLPWN